MLLRIRALPFALILLSALCSCTSERNAQTNAQIETSEDPRCRQNERPEDSSGWPERGVLMATMQSGKLRLSDARAIRAALESFIAKPNSLANVAAAYREVLRCPRAHYSANSYGTRIAGYWISPGEDAGHIRLFQRVEVVGAAPYNVVADLERVDRGWIVHSFEGP